MRFLFLSFTLICSFVLFGFNRSKATQFYEEFIQEGIQLLNRKNPPSIVPVQESLSETPSAIELFNRQGFILWLSPVSSEALDLPTYYKNVVSFCNNHGIKRVIWYFGYTSSSQAFYDPNSNDPSSFVQLLKSTPFPSGCKLELRIECASMDNGPVYSPMNTAPLVPIHTSLPAYMSTRNFYACLWWVRDLYKSVGSVIYGVTIDPQDNCDETPDYTPYASSSEADQSIVNYLDEFASLNPDFYSLKRGMTFDGSAKVQIFGNRATIPITDVNLINDTNTISNFFNGNTNGYTPWFRPNPSAPFLDTIYSQLYNISSNYIYTLASNPLSAGLSFLQLLSDTPYCPGVKADGTPSTISFSKDSTTITGEGTKFISELTTDINSNSPIGFLDSTGTEQCLCPNNDPHYPGTPVSVACTSKVHTVVDDEHLVLNINPSTTQSNVPWLYVENEINYREYYVTPAIVGGIVMMFSGEGSFFGQWTLGQFMNFIGSFYSQGQSYSLYFQDPSISDLPIPLPNQFAIFTYEQITGKSSPAPANIWFPGE